MTESSVATAPLVGTPPAAAPYPPPALHSLAAHLRPRAPLPPRALRLPLAIVAAALLVVSFSRAGPVTAQTVSDTAQIGAGQVIPGIPPAPSAAIAEDIRDIRGPKFILPVWLVPVATLAVAALAFGSYALWRWQQRRRRPRTLLPDERALARLEEIRRLLQPELARDFSIAVSDIVREYIEQRFAVTAAHRTTEEFLHDLLTPAHPSLSRHRALLAEFLHQCDLVKFAGLSLSLPSMEALHASARDFVLQTAKPDAPHSPTNKSSHDPLPAT